jgi:hypothetical protein
VGVSGARKQLTPQRFNRCGKRIHPREIQLPIGKTQVKSVADTSEVLGYSKKNARGDAEVNRLAAYVYLFQPRIPMHLAAKHPPASKGFFDARWLTGGARFERGTAVLSTVARHKVLYEEEIAAFGGHIDRVGAN